MKNARILLAVLMSLLSACPAQADAVYDRVLKTKTLRCGYVLYPPYMDKDVNTGKFTGPGYDFVEALGEVLGLKIEWAEDVPVGNDVAVLDAGRVDAICAITGTYDPNMFLRIDFSDAYFFIQNTVYARAGDTRFHTSQSMEDLNSPNITFAGIEGDATLIYARMLFPKAKIRELPQIADTAQIFMDIDAKKADLVIVETAVAQRALKNNAKKFRRVDVSGALPQYGATLAFAKSSSALRQSINEAILYMKINGITDEILNMFDPNHTSLRRSLRPYADVINTRKK